MCGGSGEEGDAGDGQEKKTRKKTEGQEPPPAGGGVNAGSVAAGVVAAVAVAVAGDAVEQRQAEDVGVARVQAQLPQLQPPRRPQRCLPPVRDDP